jgi:hypothetical protein
LLDGWRREVRGNATVTSNLEPGVEKST